MNVKNSFIRKLKEDKSIDWDRNMLPTRSLVMDVLYLLGVSINPVDYSYHDGFMKFLEDNGVEVSLNKEPIENERT